MPRWKQCKECIHRLTWWYWILFFEILLKYKHNWGIKEWCWHLKLKSRNWKDLQKNSLTLLVATDGHEDWIFNKQQHLTEDLCWNIDSGSGMSCCRDPSNVSNTVAPRVINRGPPPRWRSAMDRHEMHEPFRQPLKILRNNTICSGPTVRQERNEQIWPYSVAGALNFQYQNTFFHVFPWANRMSLLTFIPNHLSSWLWDLPQERKEDTTSPLHCTDNNGENCQMTME